MENHEFAYLYAQSGLSKRCRPIAESCAICVRRVFRVLMSGIVRYYAFQDADCSTLCSQLRTDMSIYTRPNNFVDRAETCLANEENAGTVPQTTRVLMAGKHDLTQADTLLARIWLPLPNHGNSTLHKPGPNIGRDIKLLTLRSIVRSITFSG